MPVDAKIVKVEYETPVEKGVKNWIHIWIKNTGTASGDLEYRATVSLTGQSPYWSTPWTQVFITRMLTGEYILPVFIPDHEDTYQALIVGVRDFDTQQTYDVYSTEFYVTPQPEPIVEIPPPVDIPKADLPWYLKWAEPVIDGWNDNIGPFFSSTADGIKKGIDSIGQSTADALKGVGDKLDFIGDFLKDPFGAIVRSIIGSKELIIQEAEVELVTETLKEELFTTDEFKEAVKKLKKNMTGTPAGLTDLVEGVFIDPFAALRRSIEDYLTPEPPVDFDEARRSQDKLFALAADFLVLSTILDFLLTAVSATIVRNICQYTRNILLTINFGDLINLSIQPAFKYGVQVPLEHGFADKFTPEIPATSELINEVVKEVIDLDAFKAAMRKRGFTEEWSQRIWDAHFIAPSLGQLLMSWRKGTISTEELDELEILVDLDPRYKAIWEDQRYIVPSRRELRYGFELGALTEDELRYNLQRLGYAPVDIDWMTDYMTRFTERGYMTKYLTALATARVNEAITYGELEAAVLEIYPNQPGIAPWIEKIAETRKLTEAAKRKVKALTLGQVKALYLAGDITEEELEGRLGVYGDDASLLLEYFVHLKTGVPKKASLTQLKAAFLAGDIDEEELEARLEEYAEEDRSLIIEDFRRRLVEREEGRPTRYLSPSQILKAMKKISLTEEGREAELEFTPEELEAMKPTEIEQARLDDIQAELVAGAREDETAVEYEARLAALKAEFNAIQDVIEERKATIEAKKAALIEELMEGEKAKAKELLLERGLDAEEVDVLISSTLR